MQMDEGKKKEKKINKTIGWNDKEGKKKKVKKVKATDVDGVHMQIYLGIFVY